MTTAEKNQTDDIILTVENSGDSSTEVVDEIETETFVFRARGQSEEEPLRLESPTKHSQHGDDRTGETCEVSSGESSSQGESHDEEMGQTEVPSFAATAVWEQWIHDLMWLVICFFGIMLSFVAYGIILEYATSDGRHLHERTWLHQLRSCLVCFSPSTHVRFLLFFMFVICSLFSLRNCSIRNRHGVHWKDN